MRILAIKRAVPASMRNGLDLPVRQLLSRLAGRHDVLLACWEGHAVDADKLGFKTIIQPLPAPVASGGNGNRLLDHYGLPPATAPWLSELIRHCSPDIVLGIDYHTLAALAGNPGRPRAAYLIDNRFLAARQDLLNGRVSRLRSAKELIWSWMLHHWAADAAETFIFVSDREAAGFRRFTGRPCAVVQNGVDVDYFRPNGAVRYENSVVFIGSLDFPPNVDAITWFCRHVWPRVRRVCPAAAIQIVGRHPHARIIALGGRDHVQVVADPADVRPYLARAAVAVAPMRSGGGVKNKILEAWAMSVPMVTTRMALAGLAARPGENIIVADRPADFAGAVVRCLHEPAWREEITTAGRRTVLAEHTWDHAADQLERGLAGLK